MRNVIFAINITLDGCCDHTKQFADDETHEYFTQLLQEVDLLVFGRKTYQLMVPFWPDVARTQSMTKASNEFALAFDSIPKIVFSRSLDSVADKNTRIVRTNLRDEILKLKQAQGKNILIGGVSIPSQLIELGLVDEYRFVVGPIVAGEGRRLLEGVSLPERLQLKLVDSKIFNQDALRSITETVTEKSATAALLPTKRRRTMKYICLGYLEPGKFEGMTEDEQHAMLDECFEYNDYLRANGHVVAVVPLQPPETALTLYWKNGKVATIDGPYAETKEQLGGIHILEARDLNHAIQLISQHPGMKYGSIEIRPVADLSEMIKASERRRRKDTSR